MTLVPPESPPAAKPASPSRLWLLLLPAALLVGIMVIYLAGSNLSAGAGGRALQPAPTLAVAEEEKAEAAAENAALAQVVRAPELTGGVDWLNTAKPITMKQLRGKIVLLDFWTL